MDSKIWIEFNKVFILWNQAFYCVATEKNIRIFLKQILRMRYSLNIVLLFQMFKFHCMLVCMFVCVYVCVCGYF